MTTSKWTLDEVERLGRFMADSGITLLVLPGLKLARHPKETVYQAVAHEAAKLKQAERVSDEDLLFNPTAGLEDLLND